MTTTAAMSFTARFWTKAVMISKMRDTRAAIAALGQCDKIENAAITGISLGDGVVSVRVDVPSALFYEILSQQAGVTISR